MKKLHAILITLVFYSLYLRSAYAIVDPLATENNRFGIHISDESDLQLAADLVNSNGGEWGYVTLVIREDDRDIHKWQNTFDRMRELKLIPLIRLATKMEGDGWAKPNSEEIDFWVEFLSNLNWVVKNRYIIMYNEPNHSQEWGGKINPQEYAEILTQFHEKLKQASEDFFILPAGFDASAPNSKTSLGIYEYLDKMHEYNSDIFSILDGWTSHSYPNPNFSSNPSNEGRISVKTYQWEVNYLEDFGLKEGIPIFITETGWKRQDDNNLKQTGLSADEIADNYQYAFENVWIEDQIVAVTPFILRYTDEPFNSFSWINFESQEPYPQYEVIKSLSKQRGSPIQAHKSKILSDQLPGKLVINSNYTFHLKLENTGQSIWDSEEVELKTLSTLSNKDITIQPVPTTKPFETADIQIRIKTPSYLTNQIIIIFLKNKDKRFGEYQENSIKLVSPPSLIVQTKLWIKRRTTAKDFKLLIYDYEDLVEEIYPLDIKDGTARVDKLYNLIPQKLYRFVITKPYYLPRQEITRLSEKDTKIVFKRLMPLDFDNDGKLTISDLLSAIKHPIKTLKLISPFSNQ